MDKNWVFEDLIAKVVGTVTKGIFTKKYYEAFITLDLEIPFDVNLQTFGLFQFLFSCLEVLR